MFKLNVGSIRTIKKGIIHKYPKIIIFLSGKNKGKEKNGIANFGLRPTFGKKTAILEVHLFSFKLNIYKNIIKRILFLTVFFIDSISKS